MKVVILAGGFGTRISEESQYKPKPMIEIGGKPILWHIMKQFSAYKINEFIICAGYKQEIIKEWFANYFIYNSDITFDFTAKDRIIVHNEYSEPWKVTVVDTGMNTMTGGRIKRISNFVKEETFLMTYGDGLSNINIEELIKFHKQQKKIVTLSAVIPEGRFGVIEIENNLVRSFREKHQDDMGWINGGYMVLEPEIFKYIENDQTVFERQPLEKLAEIGELACYKHKGFWQCMDTLRDKKKLETLWENGRAPWKIWEE